MSEDEADLRRAARRALLSVDLTNLEETCDEAAATALARRAITDFGAVSAVCVWPRFVALAHGLLAHQGVKVATVVNFPGGDEDSGEVADLTGRAVEDGASEIDVVIPYVDFLEGNEEAVIAEIKRVRRAAGPGVRVKAILETGALETNERIGKAAGLAIKGGADFLQSSTGAIAADATLRATRMMLEAILAAEAPVGLKPAGGIRTAREAANYLALADEVMGADWATPATFRIGASEELLDALIETLSDGDEAEAEAAPRAAGPGGQA
ncbi:deoxyribose-phosphate aldolase [Pikeienuella sp. HZG-20]|uniref:deoxyribose-phosphate aldolase n=1 Tax=Paludibacillus litoralis TaxID=3133267 RepID=UPI0030EC8E42